MLQTLLQNARGQEFIVAVAGLSDIDSPANLFTSCFQRCSAGNKPVKAHVSAQRC